jgi:site-specific DNA-methyltransferase (adenine-specific)
MELKIHPVAAMFPMMTATELAELSENIKKNGLINPCVRVGDLLIDGRNRLAACKMAGIEPKFIAYTGDSPVSFIIGVNLSRRHLDKGQKVALALEIEPHFAEEAKKRQKEHGGTAPGKKSLKENVPEVKSKQLQSRDLAAAAVGVSGKLVSAAKAIKEADPVRFEKVKAGTLSVAKAKKEIKADQDKRDLVDAQKTVTASKRQSIESVCDLRVCSCEQLFKSGIKPDAVITDPPYPAEFINVFTELAVGCKMAKVPLVAVMSGQSYLPEVYRRLCEHLRYRWTLAYMTPGGQAVQQWQAKVNTAWKPVILFGDAGEWFGDVAISRPNDNDKRFHGWGQSESGMADLVDRLTKPGQLICDPFLGGGTTAVVSLALGRRFVGCDIDANHVEQAKARVMA